jgi:hypothetical protein
MTATMTPTGTPTITATGTSTGTATVTPTDTLTPLASYTLTATPTASPSPTATDNPTATLTETPTSTPTPLPNVPGKVTGGGNIDSVNGKATFGFVIQYSVGDSNPSGNLTFKDHATGLALKATSFTLLYIDGKHATIIGEATVNGQPNLAFILEVSDQGEPGTDDTFKLQIPALDGYSAGGVITGGNLQVAAQ